MNRKLRVQTRSKHKSEIRFLNGSPKILVDGEELPLWGFQYFPETSKVFQSDKYEASKAPDIVENLSKIGMRMYYARVDLGDPEDFETYFDELKGIIRQIRNQDPNTYVIAFVALPPYDNFHKKYPDGVQTFDDGTVGNYTTDARKTMSGKEVPRHTHASLEWRHETSGLLRQLVRRIQAEPDLDDAVVGYFIFPFHFEASYFYDYDKTAKLDDYSVATQEAMKNYLAEKYAGRLDWLREAWNDETVDFEHITLPNRAERTTGTRGLFWDPATAQRRIDYAEIRSRVWADTLECFAKACKEESGGRAIVGSFWGYLANNTTLWNGQSFFRRTMDSPYLDSWGTPFPYANKHLGCSVASRIMNDSLKMRGKLVFIEADTATSTSVEKIFQTHGLTSSGLADDAELLKRDFIYTFIEGVNGGWQELNCGFMQFREDGLLPLMKQMQDIGISSIGKSMASVAEIASLVHQESLFCTPTESGLSLNVLEHNFVHVLPYLGAPVSHFEMRDALVNDLGHKMYVFENAFMLSEEERALIHQNLEKDGRVLVYNYASGFLSPDAPKASAENISDLTGIRVKEVSGLQSPRIVLTEAAAALGLTPGTEVGEFDVIHQSGTGGRPPYPVQTASIDPVFVIDDPDAVVLGVYKETGMPAFAMKETADCTRVYMGSPCVGRQVLRALAKKAGVHLVADEDSIIYENERYLGVHGMRDGELTLHLRRKCALKELFTGTEYPACEALTLDPKTGQNQLFELLY